MPTFAPKALYNVTHLIARRMGSTEGEATEVADHLVRANLAGHDSHGVIQIPTYIDRMAKGHIVPGAPFEVLKESSTTMVVGVVLMRVRCRT